MFKKKKAQDLNRKYIHIHLELKHTHRDMIKLGPCPLILWIYALYLCFLHYTSCSVSSGGPWAVRTLFSSREAMVAPASPPHFLLGATNHVGSWDYGKILLQFLEFLHISLF